jgi:ArsR family transcriptional regulator, arsenate/arsenite/antimonite-responsive transcriptional repressor
MRIDRTPTATLGASTRLLKALADPVRLRLINLLAGGREICVCHLHEALEVPQPTVSRHLAYLRKSGLVSTRKDGLWVHYRLAKPASALHRSLLVCIELADVTTFEQDRQRLDRVTSCCEGS